MNDDYSYFHKGITRLTTQSSALVSSSKYLNSPAIRDWLTTHFLRRNGVDQPVPPDTTLGLVQELNRMRDPERMQALIDREKTINPRFKAWIEERFLSRLTKEDFGRMPPDSLGGLYYKYLVDYGYEVNFGQPVTEPRNDIEYIFMRFGQIHDFEHLVTGGGFNSLGELLPYFVRLSNTHQHMSAELAAELIPTYLFGGLRMVMRAGLHYPTSWLTVMDLMRRGTNIGLASESIIMMRYEDALHLPLPAAREKLGIRNAEDVDSWSDDAVFIEKREPTEAELTRIGREDLAAVRG
jgi:ubiquinone biosynthesis protein Coq4